MRVYVPKRSGFCPGVKAAEKKIGEERQNNKGTLYVMGELIHNKHYIEYLATRNIRTVDEQTVLPKGSPVFIRTHGIPRELSELYHNRYEVKDLTCVIVQRLQKKIETFSKKGYFILITGKKSHAEVIGLTSFARDVFVIENANEIAPFIDAWKKGTIQGSDLHKIGLFSQTTGNRTLFKTTADYLTRELSDKNEIIIRDTICSITSLREEEALEIQSRVDVSFVVGDKHSSNANKLYHRLKETGGLCYFIRDLDELKALKLPLTHYRNAQVVSSSSTPAFIERKIVEYLKSF